MLRRSPHGYHGCGGSADRFQPYPEEGYATEGFAPSAKISPEFSSISAARIWQPNAGRGQPPAEGSQPQHHQRCSQGCIQPSALRGAGFLSPVPLGSWKELVWGLKSVLLLWSGRARDFSSSLLLSDRSAAGRGSPRVKWGWHCSLALQFTLFWMNS